MKKNSILILILTILILNPLNGFSQSFLKKGEKFRYQAGQILVNEEKKILILIDNAEIETDSEIVKGDYIKVDRLNKTLFVKDNAVFKTETEDLAGDKIYLDYGKEKGTVVKGRLFVKEINFYISGEKIEKISEDTYIVEEATLTSCDTPEKDWQIKADKIKATLEGYGYAINASLNTMGRPILYSPWLFFPVKTKRQTGLLIPEIEFSDKYGFQYNQPLYVVISDQVDATLYYHFMEKRSDRKGIELRFRNSPESYTELYYDEIENDPYLYNESGYTDPDIKNHRRYWFKLKSDLGFKNGFKANIDIDHASDPDYLSEFRNSYLGYDKTDESFSQNFGRNLEEDDDYNRTNRIMVSKNFKNANFETELKWNNNLVIKETGQKNREVHSLPKVSVDIPRTSFLKNFVQTSLETEYNYFHRIYGEKGHRYNFTPKVYFPFNFSNYFSIEPSVYVNETFWYTEEHDRKPENEVYDFRQIYGFDIKASSSVYKVFDIFGDRIEKIKHTITPELEYSFIPDQDQKSLPNFDDFDRIERKKEIKFSLIQTLTTKEKLPSLGDIRKYDYREYLRFELSQIYDISENEKAEESETDYEPEPFEELEAELKFSPTKNFFINFDSKWSHYLNMLTERNIGINKTTEKGSEFSFEHRFTDEENESLKFYTSLVYSPSMRFHGFYETTLMDDNETTDDYEKELGLEYTSQCWSADISYNETEKEKKFTFKIYLKGLGEIYQGISE